MPKRRKVLIVDDDPGVLLSVARALLADNVKYDVLMAVSAEVAQQIINEMTIHAMITDISLPGISGIDLLCWVAAQSPETQVAVLTGADLEEIRGQAYRVGALSIINKPFQAAAVRSLVVSMLDNTGSLSGRLSRISVADVIQMLCLSQQTAALHVVDGDETGVILIEDGEVCHAIWGQLSGEAAVFRALAARDGSFQTRDAPADTQRTIRENWQHLLIEGMRRQDEESVGREPNLDDAFAETAPVVAEPPRRPQRVDPAAAGRLLQEGFASLKRGDRATTQRLWQDALALDPDNHVIAVNLRRLEQKKD
ncbi:MAG: DUF4388 domain-containing protein [Proteobacteria bacterium]|nr:DUF4388 domain-containing protein [Pseudomonadota bacterium]